MRWISTNNDPREWHSWFAWYPVCIKEFPDGAKEYVWLKKICRRICNVDYDWDEESIVYIWAYKLIN